VLYERVIREATRVDDLRPYLNGLVLLEVWRRLFLVHWDQARPQTAGDPSPEENRR